ncbi:MAG: TonB-dependent receptor plug domain-containing protein, partial [Pelovirga sp.]
MGMLCLPVFLLLLTFGPGTFAAAADEAFADESASLYTLSPVVVRASSSEPGTATIGADELQLMPSTTGAVTEALKGMSQVQYDYDQQSSLTLGEITPPRISISGARPYENNFTIDGMSISNSINPSGFDNNVSYTELLPGGADVNIFYDTSLIDSVTLHSSNIPAQYGGFLGGVVDARLRDPQTDRWRFRVSGRYTEDSWFELRGVDRESDTPTNQPRFTVYDTSATAEGPVTDNAALLLSFSRRHSVIPLKRDLGAGPLAEDEQKRTNENYFARLALTPAADLDISFDATYAPYEEFRWRVDWPESEWKNENRSWRFAHQTDYSTSAGVLTAKLAYAQNRFRRDSVSNLTSVITDLRDPSQNDRRGAIGDAEVENREVGAAV